jgi:hypothetical protein
MKQTLGHGSDRENVLGTGSLTRAASHAFGFIYHRITVGSDMNRIEGAGFYAVSESETSDSAFPSAAVKGCERFAGKNTVIIIFICGAVSAFALVI